MPYFELLIQGSGIEIPPDGGGEPLVGFFTNCVVFAGNAELAARRSIALIAAEWEPAKRYGRRNRGSAPSLVIDEIHAISWWAGLWSRKRQGYIFYVEDGETDDDTDVTVGGVQA